MVKDSDYTPIDCATHSQFELHIMHKDSLKVCWNDEVGMTHIDIIQPYDLQSSKQGEYMYAYSSEKQRLQIRLDKIIAFSQIHP